MTKKMNPAHVRPHPKFNGSPAPLPQRDWSSREGAFRLATLIVDRWRDCNCVAEVQVDKVADHHWSVRLISLTPKGLA